MRGEIRFLAPTTPVTLGCFAPSEGASIDHPNLGDIMRLTTTNGGHSGAQILAIALFVATNATTTSAQVRETKELTLKGADAVVAAAERAARTSRARVVIAVVDAAGIPIVLRRLDGTQVASVGVAIDKARTAAIYRRPSKDFEEQVSRGRVGAMALHGAVPLQGGVPIVVEGQVVGAIGVSGETPTIDENIAIAGANVARSFKTERSSSGSAGERKTR